MILPRLTLLGGLAVKSGLTGTDTLIGRRRPLALLAMLAIVGDRGLAREAILLHLWPGSTNAKARNSLNQALFALRRELGAHSVVGGQDLRLDPDSLTCDYWQYIKAVRTREFEVAADLRRGPLLEGFVLPGAPDFDVWLAQERVQEQTLYSELLERLAREAEATGDLPGSVRWWARLADAEPLSAQVAVSAMQALTRTGDHVAALARAERYTRHVRQQLGSEPEGPVVALANNIRRNTPLAVPKFPTPAAEQPRQVEPVTAPRSPRGAALRVREVVSGWWRSRAVRLAHALGGAAIVLVVALGFAAWNGRAAAAGTGEPTTVVVDRFSVFGTPDAAEMGSALSGLLAAGIDGVAGLTATNGEAGREGQPSARGYRVAPELVRQPDGSLRAHALVTRGSRPVTRAVATGTGSDVFALVDELARQVLLGIRARSGVRASAVTTHSLAALRAYLEGEAELHRDKHAASIDAFRRAVAIDTAFAHAYYRLAIAAEQAGSDSLVGWAMARATANADSLPAQDRLLLRAANELRVGHPFEAERLYRQAVADDRDNAFGWGALGEVVFYVSPLRGRPVSDARDALRRAVALDATNADALLYLARIAATEGKPEELNALLRRVRAVQDSATAQNRAFRALALADAAGVNRVTQALLAQPTRPTGSEIVADVIRHDVAGVERLAAALTNRQLPRDAQAFGHRLLAKSLLAHGRPRAALDALQRVFGYDPAMVLEVAALYVATPEFKYTPQDAAALRGMVQAWDATDAPGEAIHSETHRGLHPLVREYLLGRLALRLNDRAEARRAADALSGVQAAPAQARHARALSWSLEAHIAAAAGRPAGALAALDRAEWPASGHTFVAEAGDRLLRAQMLEKLDRNDEASNWYSALAQRFTYELVYLGIAEYRLGLIAERLGRNAAAADHYRRALEVYSNSEPGISDDARQALNRVSSRGASKRGPTPAARSGPRRSKVTASGAD